MTQIAAPVQTHEAASNHLNPEDAHLAMRAKEIEARRAAENPAPKPEEENTIAPEAPEVKNETPAAKPETSTLGKEGGKPADNNPAEQNTELKEEDILAALELEGRKDSAKPDGSNDNEGSEVEAYRQKVKEYEETLSDPLIKAIAEAKKTGVPVEEIIKNIQGEDYSKLSAKELFELDLKQYNLSDEEKDSEREKFNGMLVSQQNEFANKFREKANQQRASQLEQLNKSAVLKEQILNQNRSKAHARINELKEKKSYNNMEITPERWSKIQEYIEQNTLHDANLEYDVDKTYRYAIYDLFEKELMVANVRKATTKGKAEVLKEMHRPSMESQNPTTVPAVTDNKKEEAAKGSAAWRESQANEFKITV